MAKGTYGREKLARVAPKSGILIPIDGAAAASWLVAQRTCCPFQQMLCFVFHFGEQKLVKYFTVIW